MHDPAYRDGATRARVNTRAVDGKTIEGCDTVRLTR